MNRQPLRKSKLMRKVEERYGGEPLEELLPRLYNDMGLPGMVREMGIGKATLYYWFLKFRVDLKRVAVRPDETLETRDRG